MSVDIRETLKIQFDALNDSYEQNLHAVQDLQKILITDILPGLADELGWDEEHIEYARDWLRDTASVFRLLRRHLFTNSFALEALRTTLAWRLATLPPLSADSPSPYIRCLPIEVHDPFGRPIVILQLASLWESSQNLRAVLLHNIELMRLHLVQLNKQTRASGPVLQYVALLDIGGMTFNGIQNIEVLSWFVHELIPKFPGLLAAAFVLNYSWAQAGLWNLSKRLLPAATLQKVFFPSTCELKAYLTPAAVPEDWGGSLPRLTDIANPLQAYAKSSPLHRRLPPQEIVPDGPPQSSTDQAKHFGGPPTRAPPRAVLSSTSLLNPFFGYPVSYGNLASSTPSFQHGRRRKRDLFYTLARLWWKRWRGPLKLLLFLLVLVLVAWKRKAWVAFLRRVVRPRGPRSAVASAFTH